MTKPNDLPLYLNLYKLLRYFYHLIHNFPKEYKYTLGQSILELGWMTLDLVILANTLPNHQKGAKIGQASAIFDQLKTRLCHRAKRRNRQDDERLAQMGPKTIKAESPNMKYRRTQRT